MNTRLKTTLAVVSAVVVVSVTSRVSGDAPAERRTWLNASLQGRLDSIDSTERGMERAMWNVVGTSKQSEIASLLAHAEQNATDTRPLVTELASTQVALAQQNAQGHGVDRKTDVAYEAFTLKNTARFKIKLGTMLRPVDGEVSTPFGTEKIDGTTTKARHTGVTYRPVAGTDVHAIGAGLVVLARDFPGYGLTVIVDHGGDVHSIYTHLQSIPVVAGDRIDAGTIVGAVGSTDSFDGAKLYFELRIDGTAVDPIPYFKK